MSEQFTFKRAQRSQARLRLALAAVSGGGKTMGALRVAKGIVEHYQAMGLVEKDRPLDQCICCIDTERNSAALYADIVPFAHLGLAPPYSVDRYNQAIHAAEQAGFMVCIIDQITHAWAGPGGQLEWIDTLKAGAKNAMSPWAKVTPVQQDFYDRMLRSPMHIIATMRSKSEWVLEEVMDGNRKKTVPRKIGMSPVQREGIEYEFTSCLDIELDSHMATSTKDRTRLFDGRTVRLDEEVGKMLASWLLEGNPEPLGVPLVQAQQQPGAGSEPGAGDGAPAFTLQRLEDEVTDHELSMLEVATMPDLASLFDAQQKSVRAYVPTLGAPVVKPFLDRLIAAKDARKGVLQGGAPASGATASAPAGDLLPGASNDPVEGDPATRYVSPEDAVQLESIALAQGLSREEGLRALGVDSFSKVVLSTYASAVDLLKLAARQKLDRAEGTKPRPKAASRRRAAAPAGGA